MSSGKRVNSVSTPTASFSQPRVEVRSADTLGTKVIPNEPTPTGSFTSPKLNDPVGVEWGVAVDSQGVGPAVLNPGLCERPLRGRAPDSTKRLTNTKGTHPTATG